MAEDDGEVDTDFPGTHILHICYSTTKPFQDLGLGFNNGMHNVEQGQNTDRKWNFHNGRTEWSQLWFYLNQPTFKRAASFLFFC